MFFFVSDSLNCGSLEKAGISVPLKFCITARTWLLKNVISPTESI